MVAPNPDCVPLLQHRRDLDDAALREEDVAGVPEGNQAVDAAGLQGSESPR